MFLKSMLSFVFLTESVRLEYVGPEKFLSRFPKSKVFDHKSILIAQMLSIKIE